MQTSPSRKAQRRAVWLAATLGLLLTVGNQPMVHSDTAEYQLKSAFIHNFARMVKWPETDSSASSGTLQVCVIEADSSDDEVTETLYRRINGKEAQGLVVDVRSWKEDDAEDPSNCQIVFFVAETGALMPELIDLLAANHILTIGETETFAGQGGVINFVTVDTKVRFEINPDAAERAGLTINSQLIRLATIVHDQTQRS